MKKNYSKFILVLLIFIFFKPLNAQNDVTKFLGIPIDGSKVEFIKNLKLKGFSNSLTDKQILVGEFNETLVNINIATTNNRVSRVMVSDANTVDEASIKIRFNKLCQQFQNNDKYLKLTDDNYEISEQEDISYEMTVKNKFFDALYYQKTEIDKSEIAKQVKTSLLSKYTNEQIENPTEEINKEIEQKVFSVLIDKITKKAVWFRIYQLGDDQYYISIYYDNEYNRANGENL
ncbi:hypothetical protein [Chryseobacterium sp. RR2-3-20]|uniref:hypothetical protein n=1 Tax=Chryseobacterium sp. RR2-3-20 TaxID=2787626 RepID=UPI001ADF1B79|nr:hypothetical protein [Chryseobacterium sp. RR2-3-20]